MRVLTSLLWVACCSGCAGSSDRTRTAELALEECRTERQALAEKLRQAQHRPTLKDAEDPSLVDTVSDTSGLESDEPPGERARISRAYFDELLNDQAELMRAVRMVPVFRDGQVVGFRMSGMRAESFLVHLGFQNGDELRRVNGIEINAPDRALEAYAEVRGARRVDVDVLRAGKPLRLSIEVDEAPLPGVPGASKNP